MHASGGSRITRRGGHGPQGGGRGLPRRLHFANFVCQNERIWTLRGGRAPGMPPLDPPMHAFTLSTETMGFISHEKGYKTRFFLLYSKLSCKISNKKLKYVSSIL